MFLKGIEGDTKVRGNLRSKGDLDVSEIAANFGGGGHHAAAGFSNNGTIRETLAVALPMLPARRLLIYFFHVRFSVKIVIGLPIGASLGYSLLKTGMELE